MIKISANITKQIKKKHFNNICIESFSPKGNKIKILPDYLVQLSLNTSLTVEQQNAISKINRSLANRKRSIITGDVKFLNRFRKKFEKKYKAHLDSNIKVDGKDYTLRNHLLKIFYYSDYDRWDAYALAKRLKVNICPYCNRIPTYTIGKSVNKSTRPQFDHFFDKARYPYLALSLYNLVPSCNICNSNYKGQKKFRLRKHTHPYIKGFDCDNIKFTIKINKIEDILATTNFILEIPKYKIGFKTIPSVKLPKNIKDLGLEKLYNYDLSYTDEIIKKSFIYNNDYVESLFKEWEGTLFGSKDEIKNLVMGNYLNIDDINKRPLGKLTKDITEELGIF